MNTTMELITGRRSIRRYTTEDIPDQVLGDIQEAARWAPSWANSQCWEIVVVKGKGLKEMLRSALSPKNPAGPAMISAPLVLAVCGKSNTAGFYKGRAVTRFGDWKLYDLGLATQNILLAAAAHGLGTVVVGAFDHQQVDRLLGLPAEIEVVTLIPVGYPDHEPGPPKRKNLGDFVHYDRFTS